MTDIQAVKDTRAYLRRNITRKCNALHAKSDSLTVRDCKDALESLKDWKVKIIECNEKIGTELLKTPNEDVINKEFAETDEYEEKLREYINWMEDELVVHQPPPRAVDASTGARAPGTKLKLPEFPLPKFSNAPGESLLEFFTNFEDIISKYVLTEYEKYVYLERQLSSDPLVLIQSLTGSRRCFDKAKELLTKAFARPIKQKFCCIGRLSNLKFDEKHPYKFISDVKLITSGFEDLKIDVDVIQQYFVWSKLPQVYQDHLQHLSRSSYPTLEEIEKFIYETIDRVVDGNVSHLEPVSLTANVPNLHDEETNLQSFKPEDYPNEPVSLAANVPNLYDKQKNTQSFKPCCLCSDKGEVDHPIFRCKTYPDAQSKIAKLKQLGLCLKCSQIKHATKDCSYSFYKPCAHCGRKNHFSFLCFKEKTQQKPINNGVCSIEFDAHALTSKCKSSTMLPTFSSNISPKESIRVLQDSGAQTSFINTDVVKKSNFKVLTSNVSLNIRGFNECKTIKTDIVEVTMNVGENSCAIPSICVPNLTNVYPNSEMKVIANKLKSKNYPIADKFILSQPSKKIDMILGADAFQHIGFHSVNFGPNTKSCMLNSEIGVMPLGNSKVFLDNLEFLPTNPSDYGCMATGSSVAKFPSEPAHAHAPDRSADPLAPPTSAHMDAHKPAQPCKRDNEVNPVSPDHGQCELNILNLFVACDTDSVIDIPNENSSFLDKKCSQLLEYDDIVESEISDLDRKSCEYVLKNIEQDDDGHLVVPLLWEPHSNCLAQNLKLSKKLLFSIKDKIAKVPNGLKMVDEVIKEQVDLKVIEPIPNLEDFVKSNPDSAFIAHMPIFKESSKTTKCRMVLLSNLKENSDKFSVSHNQAMNPGAQLNRPIEISSSLLRFDKNLLIFDLKRAFLQLKLNDDDKNKMCILWFKDALNGDFTIQPYRCLRVPFGLRCSGTLLMLALFHILVHNVDEFDDLKELKKLLFECFYVDNGGVTSNSPLVSEFSKLPGIFEPYGFELQEYATNDKRLIEENPDIFGEKCTKLLGLEWNTRADTLSPPKFFLNKHAKTKRTILSSIASNYDIFNICGPMLNRARIFMHDLQNDSKLGWDETLEAPLLKTWQNIANQLNESPRVEINRNVGSRSSQYELLAYVDASKQFYGTAVYLFDKNENKVSFLLAKNKMITKNLKSKSVASLELMALEFGVKVLQKLKSEFSGNKTMFPINIDKLRIFTDSSICLDWIRAHTHTFDKMNKKPAFVKNRLNNISELCSHFPVEFRFIAGHDNPADAITRGLSHKILSKSRFWCGPDVASLADDSESLTVPSPRVLEGELSVLTAEADASSPHLVNPTKFNSFEKLSKVYYLVLKFCSILKRRVAGKSSDPIPQDLMQKAKYEVLIRDQKTHYPDLFEYFKKCNKATAIKNIPNLVNQFNIFKDDNGILRVKCKIQHIGKTMYDFPVLLCKSSHVTDILISDFHTKLNHSGKYAVMSELKKSFYIPRCFSTVKKVIGKCVTCRRLNGKAISLNQNCYRDFRSSPDNVPFRNLILDYCGPFTITIKNQKEKVYLLIFSCLYSRAVNIQICLDLSVTNFKRSFQKHVFSWGLPSYVLSDQGSQIIPGAAMISDVVNTEETLKYLNENGIKAIKFDQHPKGCSKLGGLVEVMVKLVKRLIYGSIGKRVISYSDFELLVAECSHIVNRRPICWKEGLRDCSPSQNIPTPITPELILRGYELVSVNVLPIENKDEWKPHGSPETLFDNLTEVRESLYSIYQNEFLNTLVKQSTDLPKRYKPKSHHRLNVGDIVLIKDDLIKRHNLPLARVIAVTTNSLGETTEALLKKGGTGETVRRHVSVLIPYFEPTTEEPRVQNPQDTDVLPNPPNTPSHSIQDTNADSPSQAGARPKRATAVASSEQTRRLARDALV